MGKFIITGRDTRDRCCVIAPCRFEGEAKRFGIEVEDTEGLVWTGGGAGEG